MRKFASRSPICDTVNIHRRAVKNVREINVLRLASTTLRCMFIVSQIGEREIIQRIIMYLCPIHYFVGWSMLKYLIAREVLMGYVSEVYLLCEFIRYGWGNFEPGWWRGFKIPQRRGYRQLQQFFWRQLKNEGLFSRFFIILRSQIKY